jgi:hypothetical protein
MALYNETNNTLRTSSVQHPARRPQFSALAFPLPLPPRLPLAVPLPLPPTPEPEEALAGGRRNASAASSGAMQAARTQVRAISALAVV